MKTELRGTLFLLSDSFALFFFIISLARTATARTNRQKTKRLPTSEAVVAPAHETEGTWWWVGERNGVQLFQQMFEEAANKRKERRQRRRGGTPTGTTERRSGGGGGGGSLEKVSVDLNFAALFASVEREAFLRR